MIIIIMQLFGPLLQVPKTDLRKYLKTVLVSDQTKLP